MKKVTVLLLSVIMLLSSAFAVSASAEEHMEFGVDVGLHMDYGVDAELPVAGERELFLPEEVTPMKAVEFEALIETYLEDSWLPPSFDAMAFYPVTPRDAAWAEFKSTQEMYDATQVPFDVLRSLSDQELVNLAINHPLSINILAFDDKNAVLMFWLNSLMFLRNLLPGEIASKD
jgi:hypothetical protein